MLRLPGTLLGSAAQLEKPFRKLRKSLKNLPKRSSPEQVHDLRTRIRRLESIVNALMLDRKSERERLLRTVAPIHKKAGKVRDMDVLTRFASTIPHQGEDNCFIELVEHIGAERLLASRKLHKTIAKSREKGRRLLRRYASLVRKHLAGPAKDAVDDGQSSRNAAAAGLSLANELAGWPKLTADNLHPFRIKLKELRNVLRLADHPNAEIMDALVEVKDAIGEWHDWKELEDIAGDVLHHHSGCKLLSEIRSTVEARFKHALASAMRMRHDCFYDKKGLRESGNSRSVRPADPIVITTADFAG